MPWPTFKSWVRPFDSKFDVVLLRDKAPSTSPKNVTSPPVNGVLGMKPWSETTCRPQLSVKCGLTVSTCQTGYYHLAQKRIFFVQLQTRPEDPSDEFKVCSHHLREALTSLARRTTNCEKIEIQLFSAPKKEAPEANITCPWFLNVDISGSLLAHP